MFLPIVYIHNYYNLKSIVCTAEDGCVMMVYFETCAALLLCSD